MKGVINHQLELAWHIAMLSRQKKLMSLNVLLGEKKNEQDLKNALMGYSTKGRKP